MSNCESVLDDVSLLYIDRDDVTKRDGRAGFWIDNGIAILDRLDLRRERRLDCAQALRQYICRSIFVPCTIVTASCESTFLLGLIVLRFFSCQSSMPRTNRLH